MDRYLARLEARPGRARLRRALRLMHSAGRHGVARDARAAFPIRLLESGPAGGGARHRASSASSPGQRRRDLLRHGRHHRQGLPDRGRPRRGRADDGGRARPPLQAGLRPADQGAGHRHDRDRRRRRLDRRASTSSACCKVGPRCAGADPGPACYGRGGTEPTVTDANLLLGYLRSRLLPRRAHAPRPRPRPRPRSAALAEPLGLAPVEAAWGIHKVVVREHGGRRARAPRREGQGPAPLRDGRASAAPGRRTRRASPAILGVGEVIVPPASGAAVGARLPGGAAVASSSSARIPACSPSWTCAAVNATARRARGARAARSWRRPASPAADVTVDAARPTCASSVRCTTSRCRCRPGALRPDDLARDRGGLRRGATRAATRTLYTRHASSRRSTGASAARARADLSTSRGQDGVTAGATAAEGHAPAYFPEAAASSTRRSTTATRWRPATTLAGPAIVEEREATTVVPPGDRLEVDAHGNLRIARRRAPPSLAPVAPAGLDTARGDRADRGRPDRRSRSCGAASSPSSRRCGSPSAARPSRSSSPRRRTSPASCSTRAASRSPTRRAPCRCSTSRCRAP